MTELLDALTVVWRSVRNRAGIHLDLARGQLLRLSAGPLMRGASGLMAGQGVRLDLYGKLTLGHGVTLSDGCLLRVGPGAHLTLGDEVFVGRATVIAAHESITVGTHTMIAEHATIRDSDHALNAKRRRAKLDTVDPVVIGEDVWVAAGARILRGTRLGDGVVVAANAVVKGIFAAGMVVAGAPARVVRHVDDSPRAGLGS